MDPNTVFIFWNISIFQLDVATVMLDKTRGHTHIQITKWAIYTPNNTFEKWFFALRHLFLAVRGTSMVSAKCKKKSMANVFP